MRAWYLCVLAACGSESSPPQLPAWDKTLPPASVMGGWNGLVPARGIIHLHSPYSHDACDNMPRDASGVPNEPCYQDLRAALCAERIDFAALTDHDASMADEDFSTLFLMRDGDEVIDGAGGTQVGSRIHCDNGHDVLVSVGGENELMPIMLDRHVTAATVQERHDIYNGDDPVAAAAMRDAGATLWVAHTEQRTTQHLLDIAPDGIEVYNLHANIDPKIRPMYLGLDAYGAISAVANFADTTEGSPEPDLALLSFLTPNTPAITRLDEVLAAGRKVAVSAGSDAHENAFPVTLADGERGDSYRRVLRWFSNIALVADPTDPTQIEAAVRGGRMFSVFELMGTPVGFSVTAGGATLGDTVPVGTTMTVSVPAIRGLDPTLPAPEIRTTVVRVDATGRTDLDQTEVVLDRPGAYRVEISIKPHHLGPYLRDLGTAMADQELPWIYTSPIYVQ